MLGWYKHPCICRTVFTLYWMQLQLLPTLNKQPLQKWRSNILSLWLILYIPSYKYICAWLEIWHIAHGKFMIITWWEDEQLSCDQHCKPESVWKKKYHFMYMEFNSYRFYIKTSISKLWSQHLCASLGLRDHFIKLFTDCSSKNVKCCN